MSVSPREAASDKVRDAMSAGEELAFTRSLLRKYIRHVCEAEGVSFIPGAYGPAGQSSVEFTPDQLAVLLHLEELARSEVED